MAASVPWSVSAVDPEAWATARDAARRSGLSVGEWLESAIRDSAHETIRVQRPPSHDPSRAMEQRLEDLAERLDQFAQRSEQPPPPSRGNQSELALFASIDALNDRVDALTRDMHGDRNGPTEVHAAIQRLGDRVEDLLTRGGLAAAGGEPEIERKVDGISRALDTLVRRLEQEEMRRVEGPRTPGEELDAAVAEIMMRQSALDGLPPPREPMRVQDTPSLDLGRLENQLKTIADEMHAIRRGGAQADSIETLRREMGTLARQFADLAPRNSLQALEVAVDGIARRLDRAGGGRPDETFGEVVQALHDIRSALADVRPAESFASVERDLHELSNKLDQLHVRGVDSDMVARLQEQTEEIRELLSSALPSEVLKALVEQIELLVQKFESGASAPDHTLLDVIAGLDRRIEMLSERIDAASRLSPSQAALDEIRVRLDELQNAVVSVGQGPGKSIDSALRALSEKLDAAEAGLGNLGTIDRSLRDVFGQLQELRSSAHDRGQAPARDVDALITADSTDRARRPTADVETKRAGIDQAAVRAPATKADPHAPAAIRPLALADAASDPNADMPLEPGSGAPRMRLQSAALRVAQSEAVLDGIDTSTSATPSRTSDFIAAARRAAQSASSEPGREPSGIVEAAAVSGVTAKFGGMRRALLIALAAFLLIFGATRFFDGGLTNLFVMDPVAPVIVAPKAAEPGSNRPETATAPQDRSSLSESSDSLAGAPPAGVIGGGRELAFLGDTAVDPATTGATAGKLPKSQIQTASAPPSADDASNLPTALGTPALRAAASAGDPIAAYEIGARYLEGRGVRADPTEAIAWLERALAKGSAPAAYRLGNIYEKGHGVTKNGAEAMRYYVLGAEAGNVKAMHNLAVMHAEGPEGKPDYRVAARWFRTAAERGLRDSQYNLGVLYARGLGVEQNLTESFRWFSLAANQGDSDASKKRDDVGKRLDVQTLVAAKLAVQTWTALAPEAAANDVRLKPEWDTADGQPRKRSVKK
jgi:localization factor PodJL